MKKLFSVFSIALILAIGNIAFSQNVATVPVGAGPYPTLGAAFTAINAGGVYTGVAVTVNIIGNTVEAASATLNGGTFTTCLIRPSGGVLRTVTSAIAGATVILNGASNVTIDGLNSAGNALTFNNTNVSTASGNIQLSNGSNNNVIRNCTMLLVGISTTSGGRSIFVAACTLDIQGGNNNNIIENNVVNGGRRGIQVFGSAPVAPQLGVTDNGNIIRNNIVKNTSSLAIFIGSETRDNTCTGNEVFNDAAVSVGVGVNFRGINCQGVGTNLINNNRIHDLTSTDITATYFGVLLIPVTLTAPGSNVTTVNLYNNSVTLMTANDGQVVGIDVSFIAQEYTANVFYNTCRLAGATAVSVVAQFDGALLVTNTQANSIINIKNNIAINGRTGGDATSEHIGYDLTSFPAAGVTLNSDYNIAKGIDATAWDGGWNGFIYRNSGIDEYKDSTCSVPVEQHSMFRNANFVGTNDSHLGLVGGDMDGTPIAGVTTDIDGATRNATHPYKGCDEKTTALKVFTLGLALEGKTSDGQVKLVLKNSACVRIDSCTQDIKIASGNGAFCFGDGTPVVSYYLDLSSINHVETFSAALVSVGNTAYNFKTAVGQAFGSNQAPGPPVSFFGGDINKDETVDLTDLIQCYTDGSFFLSGCRLPSDINSDGTVDLTDLTIVFNNSSNFVGALFPCAPDTPVGPANKTISVQSKVNKTNKNVNSKSGF